MHLDRPYPYITTQENRCSWCGCGIKFVPYPDPDFGKKYCTAACYEKGVAQDIQFLEDSQEEPEDLQDIEDDICQCKRCKPPPE